MSEAEFRGNLRILLVRWLAVREPGPMTIPFDSSGFYSAFVAEAGIIGASIVPLWLYSTGTILYRYTMPC
jgi:hypothetical protein